MKKSEIITLACCVVSIAILLGYFIVSSKISRAENEAKRAQAALVEMEQREAAALQQKREQEERVEAIEKEERERLQFDFDWVVSKGSIQNCKVFATRFPDHPNIKAIEKRLIDLEVEEIAAGEYGEMPKARPLSFGGTTTEVEIENKTGYVLTVRYSGVDSQMLVIPVSATSKLSLQATSKNSQFIGF